MRNKEKFLKKFDSAKPRKKRAPAARDTFRDVSEEDLLLGCDIPDARERAWLLWYAQATAPGYPGPDIGCRSTIDPYIIFTTHIHRSRRKSTVKPACP